MTQSSAFIGDHVKLKFFATYRPIVGCSQMEVPAPEDVGALLNELVCRYPDFRDKLLDDAGTDLGPEAIVLVNGRHIQHIGGVQKKLSEDDVVAVFPLVAGG